MCPELSRAIAPRALVISARSESITPAVATVVISPTVLARVRAFAEALFSTAEGAPPAERLDWLTREFADYLVKAGGRARLILSLALFAVSWLAPLMVDEWPTIVRLDRLTRIRALERMEASFLSAAVLAVKAFLCVIYYEHPDVQREVGYVGAATFPMALEARAPEAAR